MFYWRYAYRNLRGRWTAFAVLCVAAGVATVVALRSLGLAIGDSLLSNLREINRGDITIGTVNVGLFSFTFNQGEAELNVFSSSALEQVRELVRQYGGQMTAYSLYNNVQVTPFDDTKAALGRPQFVSTFFIDPQTFSVTRSEPIRALEPEGVLLSDLFSGAAEIVISENLAAAQEIGVGDAVRVTGTDMPFIVRGIVPTDTEANINNVAASFFGFAYIDAALAPIMQLNAAPNRVGIVLPDGSDAATIERLNGDLWINVRGMRSSMTTPALLERNKQLSDMLGRFIVVLGLGALLIGGVGIVNTMLVMVGRRTLEIASLKTLGLKGHQIARLFLAEAFLLGVVGCVLGVVIGLLLSLAVNEYGEALLQQRLTWRFYPEAVVYGIGLGMIVTMVFGVLPVLMAAQVRPAIILRPNQVHLPRAGLLTAAGALSLVVIVLGAIAGQIMGPLLARALGSRAPNPILVGMAGVAALMLFLGLIAGLLWLVVWIISRMPAFGSVSLRLALRNMTARRARTATTLLALMVGMFALSSISFFGLGARKIIQFQFSETLGGNVMVVPLLRDSFSRSVVDSLLALRSDVIYDTQLNAFPARLVTVDGNPIQLENSSRTSVFLPSLIRQTNHPDLRSGILVAGRDLTPEDRGKPVIVLADQSLVVEAFQEYTLADLSVGVNSTVTLRIGGQMTDFTVVGIVTSPNSIVPNFGSAFIPPGVIEPPFGFRFHIVDVPPEQVNGFLQSMAALPFVLVLDVTFIDSLLTRLIDQLSAIPTLVGLLSLLAAAVIMANTVALTVLERRQQIGILKTIGLKRRRVLTVMLLENTVIGLLGALVGIALSSLGVSVMTGLGMGIPIPIPEEAIPVAAGLVLAGVVIAWLATFLSARAAINERVARVLRYE